MRKVSQYVATRDARGLVSDFYPFVILYRDSDKNHSTIHIEDQDFPMRLEWILPQLISRGIGIFRGIEL